MTRPALLFLALLLPAAAGAQQRELRPVEALAADAATYAKAMGVDGLEALRRLQMQEASVPATDGLALRFRDRLAGIAIEHSPDYRIVVSLTGSEPAPPETVIAAGYSVPVEFRTGAGATRARLIEAIHDRRETLRALAGRTQGLGADPRTGELVVMLTGARTQEELAALDLALERAAGVPVQLRLLDSVARDARVEGGARLEGPDAVTGRRTACTTGFAVTDGTRTGVVTAAHCTDEALYLGPDGTGVPLAFEGQWGARYQDVQVHVAPVERPLFYSDTAKTVQRPVTTWRNRASTRSGDFLCHRGEATGYSCAVVDLVDYAPPGDLCGGPCDPTWVTVSGPGCRGGDSGGPVFLGTTAFGILKGGSYAPGGRCRFYYYMSTDYLPTGWSLLRDDESGSRRRVDLMDRQPLGERNPLRGEPEH